MGLTRYIVASIVGVSRSRYITFIICFCWFARMRTYVTFPATAIDITAGTALDICRGTGCEAIGIILGIISIFRVIVVSTHTEDVAHVTCRAGSIDIFLHSTTKQGNIGVSIDVATTFLFGRTIAATIGVVHHLCVFVNDDIGAINVLALCLFIILECREISLIYFSLVDQRGVS